MAARRPALRRLQPSTLTVAGARVRVHRLVGLPVDAGDAADVPVFVLVHGLGVSSLYFVELAEMLARFGEVCVFDLPGFGGVPRPRDPLRIPAFADVVREACGRLGIVNPVLIGHSMGTQIVVEAMAGDRGFATAAVLVGPVSAFSRRQIPDLARCFLQSARYERPSSALAAVKGYVQGGLRWPLEILPAMVDYPMEERLAEVSGRLTFMHGENDLVVPPAWVERLAAAATAADVVRVVEIKGAAHQVVIDHASIVADEALTLAGVGLGGPPV